MKVWSKRRRGGGLYILRWDRAKIFFEHMFRNFFFYLRKMFFDKISEKILKFFLSNYFLFNIFLWAGGFFFLKKNSSETYAQKYFWILKKKMWTFFYINIFFFLHTFFFILISSETYARINLIVKSFWGGRGSADPKLGQGSLYKWKNKFFLIDC